ncbi:MAG: hypothetical protein LBT16_06800, partial [Treponema sp.]|nr:hypothetical protein [Treponema sp.]
MKGILKRLAPLLLFFGFITMQAFSQGRPLLVYDMDWRGELIITITLEEDIPCKQVIKNGQTKYYIDRISSYGIDMVTNNIPADIKYEAQVST